jgi:bacillithiol system protein YtxJ
MPILRSVTAVQSAWDARLSGSPVAVLYKHSPTCGLSSMALDEVEAFSAQHPDVPIYMVDVLSQRPLSNEIEAILGIRHESPQAFVFHRGAVVWHGSHRRVQRAMLAEQVSQAESASGAP